MEHIICVIWSISYVPYNIVHTSSIGLKIICGCSSFNSKYTVVTVYMNLSNRTDVSFGFRFQKVRSTDELYR